MENFCISSEGTPFRFKTNASEKMIKDVIVLCSKTSMYDYDDVISILDILGYVVEKYEETVIHN